jgi:hypothetical protein
VICQPEIKEKLEQGLTGDTLLSLTEHTTLPLKLATPIAIYVVKAGLQNFCQSFEAKIR